MGIILCYDWNKNEFHGNMCCSISKPFLVFLFYSLHCYLTISLDHIAYLMSWRLSLKIRSFLADKPFSDCWSSLLRSYHQCLPKTSWEQPRSPAAPACVSLAICVGVQALWRGTLCWFPRKGKTVFPTKRGFSL